MTHGVATLVIVAAGRGERFGEVTKVLAVAGGRPLLLWSLLAAEAAELVVGVVVVAGQHTTEPIARLVASQPLRKPVRIVQGGATRRESVAAGVAAVPESSAVVLVHDAARPLVTAALFDRCAALALERGAAIVAAPVTDTLKHVSGDVIDHTVSRDRLWGAQTPQGFRREVITSAIARTAHLAESFTDEASLLEALGELVAIVPGTSANLKVTHRDDLDMADALLRQRCRSGKEPIA